MLKKFYGWQPFEEAREYVRGLGLRNLSEWLAWAKSEARPGFIPANPSEIYWRWGGVDIGDTGWGLKEGARLRPLSMKGEERDWGGGGLAVSARLLADTPDGGLWPPRAEREKGRSLTVARMM
jgi:hypothetical protein